MQIDSIILVFSGQSRWFALHLHLFQEKQLFSLTEEVDAIMMHLIKNPTIVASIQIEIRADNLESLDEATQRTIKENSNTLKFDLSEFE